MSNYFCMAEKANGDPCAVHGQHIAYGIYVCHLHLRPFLRHVTHEYVGALGWELQEQVEGAYRELARIEAKAFELRRLVARAARRSLPAWVREHVIKRDGRRCTYCEGRGDDTIGPDGRSWHIDHVQPVIDGGSDDLSNLALACGSCNSRKHSMPLGLFLDLLEYDRTKKAA